MATAPKFEADISADISKFMRNMATVDKRIKDLASGVIVDIKADISGFMQRAATVQNTINDIQNENPTIIINANAGDFTQSVNEVNRQTNKLSRRITEARIGADIGSFESRMVEVARALEEAGDTVTPQIELEMTRFTRDITEVQDRMREIARSTADPQVEADIAGFMAQMAAVQAQLDVVTREHDVDIRVDAGGASARLAALWLQIRAFTVRDFVINMRASWANYQTVMGAMATFSRNFSEIVGMTARGITIAMSPAIVPVLASVVGLLGNLGPMLGTVAGSSFALVTAFGAAGLGAAGFAAVAIPSIGGVIKTSQELKDIEEKIAAADTWKERNKLMKEQSAIIDGMSKAQKTAGDALNKFKDNYSKLVKDMESPVLEVFAGGLAAITGILNLARPMIENVTNTLKGMMDTLNTNLEADDVKAFFGFLADYAGPALETISEAIGNFTVGLFNMMEAFGPLSTETQNGFLAMSESFRDWAAGLSESKKFQAFVDYVSENMPKIRSIFSDAIQGMINMFGGFGGSSSDMMTSLQDMMERFKNFSSTISENQGFQKFIDYIKTNGPVVVAAIGEIITFIVNLGIAAAPMGEKILAAANSVIEFANGLLEGHSWLGKVAIAMVVLLGAFLAVLPTMVLLNALFGGIITSMILFVARTTWAAAVSVAKWLWMATVATANAIRMALAWTVATGVSMVVAVAKMIASAAIFVARWVFMGAQALLHAAKVAAAWLLSTGVAMVTAVASMVATAAVFVAKWVWMGAQALFAAARMAAAWFIALGPIGWVAGAIIAIVALVILNWDKVSAWTSKAWSATAKFVTDAVSKIAGWIQQKFPALYAVIASYMTMAKTIISSAWNYIKGTFSNVLSFLKALVKGDFQGMKTAIQNQMDLAKATIQRVWGAVKSYLSTLLGTLVTKFSEMFGKMVTKIREKTAEAVRVLKGKVGEMPGVVLGFVGDMLSAGGELVSGLINGIKNMGGAALEAISGVVGGVIGKAKSLLQINSPSRVFTEFGAFVSEGLANGVSDKAKLAVDNVARMASQMSGAFNPQFAMADMRASAQLDTSINRADMGVVRKSFAAEIGDFEKSEPDLYLIVDGKELGKVVAKPVQEENDRRGAMLKVGRGR